MMFWSIPTRSRALQVFPLRNAPKLSEIKYTAPHVTVSLPFRPFSTTPKSLSWLQPKRGHKTKSRKGRPRVPTGGSTRGTTVVWGDWGLRMKDHDRRVSAAQLSIGAETIKRRLRGLRYRFYTRICANIGVYTSGNDVRMGKGKGSFDHWASRVAVSKIIFEVKGDLHEKVVRDAFRLAASRMPGQYEFVRKGDPPVVGITPALQSQTVQLPSRIGNINITGAENSRLPATVQT